MQLKTSKITSLTERVAGFGEQNFGCRFSLKQNLSSAQTLPSISQNAWVMKMRPIFSALLFSCDANQGRLQGVAATPDPVSIPTHTRTHTHTLTRRNLTQTRTSFPSALFFCKTRPFRTRWQTVSLERLIHVNFVRLVEEFVRCHPTEGAAVPLVPRHKVKVKLFWQPCESLWVQSGQVVLGEVQFLQCMQSKKCVKGNFDEAVVVQI